jgi:hypothetical protein
MTEKYARLSHRSASDDVERIDDEFCQITGQISGEIRDKVVSSEREAVNI